MNTTSQDAQPDFEALLDYLKRNRGFDFTGYKRMSLMRRIEKRMQMVGIDQFLNYVDYLEVHPDEFAELFNMILINVTAFFRDQPTWDYLTTDIVPRIVGLKTPNEVIRIWSAGCASGEEAYTLAMVFAEALGKEQFHKRVKIYATDLDEDALNRARQATYTAHEMLGVRANFQEKYFERADQRYTFVKDLRRAVIFGRHNLYQDAPISRIDLLVCRNALMYFNADAQKRILSRLHFALNPDGFLFLGKAEMLLTHTNLFTPVDLRRRMFTKVPKINMRDKLLGMAQTGNEDDTDKLPRDIRFREAAFDASPVAQVVIATNRLLMMANERARTLFNLLPGDIDHSVYDLEFSYRLTDLRTHLEDTFTNRRAINLKAIDWTNSSGDVRKIETQIVPLLDALGGGILGISVTFTDVTPFRQLQQELERANQDLETAYQELQSTNEELETTNEELQSTVEESETTNEELQSTNEELETMNAELQSTNEELQTLNDELHRSTEEINRVNAFLESILTTLKSAVVVLNLDLSIQIWSPRAEELWGLRANEAEGKNFLSLDIGLPVEQLKPMIRSCINQENKGRYEMILPATNRRGKAFQCRIDCAALLGSEKGIPGVILLMEDAELTNSHQPTMTT